MLGRTANGLYWMFRYIERAENIARLVDAGMRMSLTRMGAVEDDWDGVLQSAGVRETYDAGHAKLTGADAIDYLLRDRNNPSSVMSCIDAGRNNARMVRTALTRETWEATNECWIDLKALLGKRLKAAEMPEVIDAIKRRAGLIRGAFHGSMLRNELYNFARIGTFIERADNTARILDVKYYVLLPSVSAVGSSLDNVQWESILRSVSAHRSYSWVYDAEYKPSNIADFLILNSQMPRSLAYCYEKIVSNLSYLAREDGERLAAHDTGESIRKMLQTLEIKDIMNNGLHEFLENFVWRNNQLGQEISDGYRFNQ
ncbi:MULTISPECIES: alpha-E domain-containing protein [unclassified Rhizobium]|uniref:alpha-E domain-containing protein n=1 Tax=unclassified Rhizobium TaxID=2613769 RepID=UPI001ADB08C2|nr:MULTISPECIES: alpha-E domain-containing protein [unclassified Rhizobium]MBO9099153.1 alpha-E domain-containing protein [Rhizobium sp. L58/93]MBO9132041.1 alpha-E domain-containing protein [Rhizobium sp. B209b/85]MBO9169415.1 alpha-E domain-containing protein [Rhizobium sp. L245/93]MBO9185366.1 alpha-E domain-containing protein [Rhizobium sp. E27B/91]QXZ85505.1 alpha-E domain-containing protein [Rhizobium sp. K1/93]